MLTLWLCCIYWRHDCVLLTSRLCGVPQAEGETEILVPGDPEERFEKLCETRGGIPYHPNQIKYAVSNLRRAQRLSEHWSRCMHIHKELNSTCTHILYIYMYNINLDIKGIFTLSNNERTKRVYIRVCNLNSAYAYWYSRSTMFDAIPHLRLTSHTIHVWRHSCVISITARFGEGIAGWTATCSRDLKPHDACHNH